MNRIPFLLLALFLIPALSQAQYRLASEIPVFHGSHELVNAWAGGFNNPQFSHFDLNNDGLQDIVIYDKGDFRFYGFVNEGGVGMTEYRFEPEYSDYFPDAINWAVLKDYDNDGIQDLFAYIGAGMAAWKGGYDSEGKPSFTLVKDKVRYVNGALLTPVYASPVDLPGFADVNGDGDLDIFAFGSLGGFVRYYENRSVEEGWGTDSLLYDLTYNCWGHWLEGTTCKGGTLNETCFAGPDIDVDQRGGLHAGSTILVLDKNGDGLHDLVLGDAGCVSMTLLRNSTNNTTGQIVSQDIKFPAENNSVLMATHPTAFGIDVDQDGEQDILVSPNDTQDGFDAKNSWLYRDVSTDSVEPVFVSDSFLVDGIIDAGSNSRPVVVDVNQDGLLDLLIGVRHYYVDTAIGPEYGLWYYQNTGTLTDPEFSLISRDFSDLSVHQLAFFSPTVGDLDGDGDLDLVSGDSGGNLHYFENVAPAGATMEFVLTEPNYKGINVGVQSAPFLFDVNRDGLLDLIIGERNGNLNYWRNFGTATSANFIEDSPFWGGVDVRATGWPTGFSVPFLRINSGNQIELYVGSQFGGVHRYSNLDGNLLGTFTEEDSVWKDLDGGELCALHLADINGDSAMDAFFGNSRGGIMLYTEKGQPIVSVEEVPATPVQVQLFPNPASDRVIVELSTGAIERLELLDLSGRILMAKQGEGENRLELNLQGMSSGLYLVNVRSTEGLSRTMRVLKTE